MTDHRTTTALGTAALALAAAVLCGALLLSPGAAASPWRTPSLLVTLGVAALLHWVALGRAAARMGRFAPGWLALSVLLFPVGSAAALVLLGWLRHEPAMVPAH